MISEDQPNVSSDGQHATGVIGALPLQSHIHVAEVFVLGPAFNNQSDTARVAECLSRVEVRAGSSWAKRLSLVGCMLALGVLRHFVLLKLKH